MQNQNEKHWYATRPFAKFAGEKEKNKLTDICQEYSVGIEMSTVLKMICRYYENENLS